LEGLLLLKKLAEEKNVRNFNIFYVSAGKSQMSLLNGLIPIFVDPNNEPLYDIILANPIC
jgi:hypothetical protein